MYSHASVCVDNHKCLDPSLYLNDMYSHASVCVDSHMHACQVFRPIIVHKKHWIRPIHNIVCFENLRKKYPLVYGPQILR